MSITQAGRKRKRDEAIEADEALKSKIGGKIHHEKKLVYKACKKAKTFEIQKVVQRLKNERKRMTEGMTIDDYEAQLLCLKAINDDEVGNSALRSKILKDHTLRYNEDVLSFVTELEANLPATVEPGSTNAKMQSRLLSSKTLAAQVFASVESVRFLVNPALKIQKAKTIDDKGEGEQIFLDSKTKGSLHQPVPFRDFAKDSSPMSNVSGWESGTIDCDSVSDEGHSSRVSLSFNLEAQSESDDDSDRRTLKNRVVGNNSNGQLSKNAIKESTFLPSLSVGFVPGSDSDFDETTLVDMPRKNRRGQRARRAIWEKKYGRQANHKKKEAEERAVVFAKKAAKAQTVISASNAQQRLISGAAKESTNVRWADGSRDVQGLHPSWEAKRKYKDKDQGNIVPSQGKKIKF